MAEPIKIHTPFTEEMSKKFHIGDAVLITGEIYAARDAAHKKMCEALAKGEKLPIDWHDKMVYYLGPTPAKPGDPIGSCGPTTSGRMDAYSPALIDRDEVVTIVVSRGPAEVSIPALAGMSEAQAREILQQNRVESGQATTEFHPDVAEGTVIAQPTETFTDRKVIDMGDISIEVLHLGPAHSPGDTQVWIPAWSMMIAGDIAFHERMPPIFEGTCTSCWIETWDTALTPLNPTYLIPGHGHPTNLAQVTRYTRDYLLDLREKIAAHLEAGGDLAGAYYVDQSRWQHLDTFEELATKNAGVVFAEMEFE